MEEQGITLAVSEASLRYMASARYDDMIRVETVLARVTSRTMVFDYTVSNAATGTKLATVSTTLISLDDAGRVRSLPPEGRARHAREAGDAS
jgi:acyl-CoA thioester hydrolase